MSEDDVATKLAVHEAVCAERWKQANERLGRIEVVLPAIVLLLGQPIVGAGGGTLKEQAIHGRVFQTIDEVRDAVRGFANRYNAEWLVEKNGYLSPLDARAARLNTTLRRAASCNRVSREPGAVQHGRHLTRRGGSWVFQIRLGAPTNCLRSGPARLLALSARIHAGRIRERSMKEKRSSGRSRRGCARGSG